MIKKIWLILIAVALVTCFYTACSSGSSGTDIKGFTVTFDKNGGDTEASPTTKTVYSPATTIDSLPTAPTRAGYAFTGWNTEADGSGTPFTASTPVTADITVYAQWRHQSQSGELIVTFHKNGGDTEADPNQIDVVPPATTIDALPTAPTRTGYTFAGWNTEPDGSGEDFTAATPVTTDINVYAQWTANVYYITCDKNGGDTEANPKIITITFPDTTIGNQEFTRPTRAGYLFKEWNTKADGTGTVWTRETNVTQNVTVYAIWEKIEEGAFIVTFDKNGGDIDPLPKEKQVVPPATTVDALPEAPTYADHAFTGWNTKADGSGTAFTVTTPVTATITVYAQWVRGFTVTFNPNGGSGEITTKTVIPPATTVDALPTAPTRATYIFGGWYTTHEATGGTEFTATTTVTDDITVYARWAPVPTVTFNKNNTDATGAMEAHPQSEVAEGGTVALPTTPPTRSEGWGAGMVFDGWNTEANGTGTDFTASTPVTADITVYAKWRFVAGTPTVVGDTWVHDAPGTPKTTSSGQGSWSGTENADGSATFSSGAISYMFPAGYAEYDFVRLEYVSKGTAMQVILKKGTSSTDWVNKAGTQYPNLPADGNGFVEFNVADASSPAGISMQRNNGGPITVKFTKVTFTQAPKHTITFNANHTNGEAIASIRVADGTPMSNLPTPASRADKYTFVGWYDAASGGTLYTKTSIMPANDLALFAQWEAPIPIRPNIDVDFSSVTFAGVDGNGGSISTSSNNATSYTYTTTNYNQGIAFKIDIGDAKLSDYDKISFTVTGSGSDYNNKPCNVAGAPGTGSAPSYANPSNTNNAFITTYGGGNNITGSSPFAMNFTIDKAKSRSLSGEIWLAVFIHAGGSQTYTISDFKIIQTTKVDFSGMSIGNGFASIGGTASVVSNVTSTGFTYETKSGYGGAIAFKVSLGSGVKLSDYNKISFTVTPVSGDYNSKTMNLSGGTTVPAYKDPGQSGNAASFFTNYGTGQNLTSMAVGTPKSFEFTIDKAKADTLNLEGDIYIAIFIHANPYSLTISNFELY
jgi:uncharacterized repeat protein (TIGR02543 family)